MKVHRWIVTDVGVVLIADVELTDEARAEIRAWFDAWSKMAMGEHYPVLILPGDADTKVDDLRTVPA